MTYIPKKNARRLCKLLHCIKDEWNCSKTWKAVLTKTGVRYVAINGIPMLKDDGTLRGVSWQQRQT